MTQQTEQSNTASAPAAAMLVPDEEMLLGSMRDYILDGVKPAIGWSKLKEKQQHTVNNAVEQACRQAIRGAAPIIAGRGFETISTTVGDINTKGELVIAKLSAERTRENILGLAEAGRCTLVLVDTEAFMGAKPAAVMKDQPNFLDETPEAKAKREAIDRDAAEHEESVARAGQFGQAELPEEIGGIQTARAEDPGEAEVPHDPETGEVAAQLGEMLPPAIKAAADRGRAHAEAGGACTVPKDLEGKLGEVGAWLKGYDSVAHAAGTEAAKPKRRGRRSVEDRLEDTSRELQGA